jgi:LacI family transcriptional regulator
MPPSVPTLGTIAAMAGVSRMTVSLALRHHPRISPAVRKTVQALARQVGYRPDPEVARFMTYLRTAKPHQRGSVIGFLHCLEYESAWRHEPRFARFHASAAKRCAELGYRLEVFWMGVTGMTPQRMAGILHSRGIEGVLLTPLLHGGGYGELDFSRLAVVAIGYSVLEPRVNRVSANHFHATSLALAQVHQHGYRNPGLCLREDVDATYGHQIAAAFRYYEYRFATGRRLWPSLITRTLGEREFVDWVGRTRPDVVLGPNAEALDWLRRAGWNVPGKIGYVNLSRLDHEPECAGIALNYEGVAAAAVDLLATHVNHRQMGIPATPFSVQIEGTWVPGSTIRNISRRKAQSERRVDADRSNGPVLDGFAGPRSDRG